MTGVLAGPFKEVVGIGNKNTTMCDRSLGIQKKAIDTGEWCIHIYIDKYMFL